MCLLDRLDGEGDFWAVRYQVSYLPSLSTLGALPRYRFCRDARLLTVTADDPAEPLRYASEEARRVAALFGDHATSLADEATRDNVIKLSKEHPFILFATHARACRGPARGAARLSRQQRAAASSLLGALGPGRWSAAGQRARSHGRSRLRTAVRKGGFQGWLDSIGKLGAAIGTLVTLLLVLGYAGLSAQINALGFEGTLLGLRPELSIQYFVYAFELLYFALIGGVAALAAALPLGFAVAWATRRIWMRRQARKRR